MKHSPAHSKCLRKKKQKKTKQKAKKSRERRKYFAADSPPSFSVGADKFGKLHRAKLRRRRGLERLILSAVESTRRYRKPNRELASVARIMQNYSGDPRAGNYSRRSPLFLRHDRPFHPSTRSLRPFHPDNNAPLREKRIARARARAPRNLFIMPKNAPSTSTCRYL